MISLIDYEDKIGFATASVQKKLLSFKAKHVITSHELSRMLISDPLISGTNYNLFLIIAG